MEYQKYFQKALKQYRDQQIRADHEHLEVQQRMRATIDGFYNHLVKGMKELSEFGVNIVSLPSDISGLRFNLDGTPYASGWVSAGYPRKYPLTEEDYQKGFTANLKVNDGEEYTVTSRHEVLAADDVLKELIKIIVPYYDGDLVVGENVTA